MKLVSVQDGVGIKELHWDLDIDSDTPTSDFEILPISDTHIGSPVCDLEAIKKSIKYVLDNPRVYVTLHGDIIDNGIPGSKTDTVTQTMSMQEQLNFAVELFEPIKDRILCITDGNHEERTKRSAGIDLLSFFAFKLGLEEIYSPGTGTVLLDLKFGRGTRSGVKGASHHFTVVVAHGARGGATYAAAVNGLEGLQKIITNADLYIIGHTHKIINFIKETYFVNTYGFLETKVQYYINSTAYLRYGDYGKAKLFPPSTIRPQAVTVRASKVQKIRGKNTNRTKQYFICDVKNVV